MPWIPGRVFVRRWGEGEGEKGEGDKALLAFRWLLSLPRLSNPLSPSTVGVKTGIARREKGWWREKKNLH